MNDPNDPLRHLEELEEEMEKLRSPYSPLEEELNRQMEVHKKMLEELEGSYKKFPPDYPDEIPGLHALETYIEPIMPAPGKESALDFFNTLRFYIEQMKANLGENDQLLVCHHNQRGEETIIWNMALKEPDLITLFGDNRIIVTHVNSLQVTVRVQELEEPEKKREIRFSRLEPQMVQNEVVNE